MREELRNEKGFRISITVHNQWGRSAGRGRRPRIESICSQTQHTPQSRCQTTLQSPINPIRRTTGSLGCQFSVIVTLAGAASWRPQAGSLQTTQHPQKPRHRCHIHLKAMLLRTYCHSAPVLTTPAVLWVGHRRRVTRFCSTLNPWSAIETHEALCVPAHTRAERWGLAAPFPAGGDSHPPAPSPASISRSHPERAGAAPAHPCAHPRRLQRALGAREWRRSSRGRTAGTGKPSARGHRPGRGLRLPRHRERGEGKVRAF